MTEKKRVLVVDDEEDWRESIRSALQFLGCEVDVASDYHEARNLLQQHAYALVVSDNAMPDPDDGVRLLYSMRLACEKNYETRFILHTGDDRLITQQRVSEQNGWYMKKNGPVSLREGLEAGLRSPTP